MIGSNKGNKYAQKWTEEKAEQFCDSVFDELVKNKKIHTVNAACVAVGSYETQLHYLEDIYPDNKQVFESLKKIKSIAKERLTERALNNECNATMAIFILKCNHDMVDKQTIEHHGAVPVINEVHPE